jgi:hypothetical protein
MLISRPAPGGLGALIEEVPDGSKDLEAVILCPGHIRRSLGKARQENIVQVGVGIESSNHKYRRQADVVVHDVEAVKLSNGLQEDPEESAGELGCSQFANFLERVQVFPIPCEQI